MSPLDGHLNPMSQLSEACPKRVSFLNGHLKSSSEESAESIESLGQSSEASDKGLGVMRVKNEPICSEASAM